MELPVLYWLLEKSQDKTVILEIKAASQAKDLKSKVQEAKEQMVTQKYIEDVRGEGYEDIIAYGVAFYKKDCMAELV